MAFLVDVLRVTSIRPTAARPGAAVTFTGTRFGATPRTAWLGSTEATILSWTDTQVVAAVASDALSGIARIQRDDRWSNALGFVVPVPGVIRRDLLPLGAPFFSN